MDFVWDPPALEAFNTSSQRARYLKCDGRLNLPSDHTPLFAIQHIDHDRARVYNPIPSTFVIKQTEVKLYSCTLAELQSVAGRWAKRDGNECQDPLLRLKSPSGLWQSKKKPSSRSRARNRMLQDRMPIYQQDMKSLYDVVTQRSGSGDVQPTYSGRQFLEFVLPRPEADIAEQ